MGAALGTSGQAPGHAGGEHDHNATALRATAGELARLLDAQLIGDGGVTLTRLGVLSKADGSTLSFVRDAKHAPAWASSSAAAALVSRHAYEASDGLEPGDGRALLVVDDADRALITLLEIVADADEDVKPAAGVHPDATVHDTAEIDPTASIGAKAVIGAFSVIGAGCVIHPGVVIGHRCTLGEGVIVHPNAVIGADGFGYRPSADGTRPIKVPHIGRVEIGDGVEIGAGTCIDRGKFDATRVGAFTKIDNLVQVGHNCAIGRSCLICGCVGIGGSTTLGDGVTLGGGAGIGDNLTIGDGAKVAAYSAVMHDIEPGATVVGVPAIPHREFAKQVSALRKLPGLIKTIKAAGSDPSSPPDGGPR